MESHQYSDFLVSNHILAEFIWLLCRLQAASSLLQQSCACGKGQRLQRVLGLLSSQPNRAAVLLLLLPLSALCQAWLLLNTVHQ